VPGSLPADSQRSHDPAADARTADERAADHAAIDRLTEDVLPALIAKLGATGLGELEVREGGWRVRLRRPADGQPPARSRRPAERSTGDRPERGPDRSSERAPRTLHRPLEAKTARTQSRAVATSPAVGIYRPRVDLAVGARVRAGDRVGAVDILGVAQEVVAPVDGILGSSLVESGDAVEYGQEILVIEFTPNPASTNGTGG
jgi:acetyl-CoA carboxylase biotin carboxyl carrier protein